MTWGDVQLIRDVDGTECFEYSKRQTKTRTGAEIRNIRSVKPKAFATQDGPDERNPVFFLQNLSRDKTKLKADHRGPFLS